MTVYITGDTHGRVEDIRIRMAMIPSPSEEDIIIIAGDAGLEYGNLIMDAAKEEMSKFPGTWIVMRGNHDTRYWRDHTEWRQTYTDFIQEANEDWHFEKDDSNEKQYLVQNKYSNIWYVKDEGGIYNIQGKTFLFIPGAYSVDKFYRINSNYPYEPEEQLSYVEFMRLYNNVHDWILSCLSIDYIVSHTCPLNFEPYIRYLFMGSIKQSDVDKNTEKWLNEFQELLEPHIKHWYFGHYHDDRKIQDKYTMLFQTIKKIEDQ